MTPCRCASIAIVLVLLAVLLVPKASAQALDPRDLAYPTFTAFTARDGLPEGAVRDLRTDRSGFVWAGTSNGPYRYDGSRWTPPPDPRLAHPVSALWIDHAGTLWVGFRSHGIASFDGTRWRFEDAASGNPTARIRRFAETRDGDGHHTLWALTAGAGLLRHRDGRWVVDPKAAALGIRIPLAMAQTRTLGGEPRMWLGTESALWYRRDSDSDWTRWQAPELGAANFEALAVQTRNGRDVLWASVFGYGIWRLDDAGLQHFKVGSRGMPTGATFDLATSTSPDGSGTLWAASRSGVIRIRNGRVQVFDRRDGLPADAVYRVNVWRSPLGNDVLWLATDDGTARSVLDASAWTTVSRLGAPATGVFAVLLQDTPNGQRLWIGGADDGLALYQDGQWRHFSLASGALPSANVSTIEPDGHGGLWIANDGYLLHERDIAGGPRFTIEPVPWKQSAGINLLTLLARSMGGHDELWAGVLNAGLFLRRDGRWRQVVIPELVATSAPRGMLEFTAADGRRWLWAAFPQGVASFDGERWRMLRRGHELPDAEPWSMSLHRDANGRPILWIGAKGRIVRIDIHDPQRPRLLPDTLPRLPDSIISDVSIDSAGRILVCSNHGVQQLTPTSGGYRTRLFTRADGMVHDECNGTAQVMDARDRYWVGTLGGLTVHDPRGDGRDTLPKPLRLTAVRVDGKAMPLADIAAPPDTHRIEVEYSLLAWYRERESRYRTQLLGYEPAPTGWQSQPSREFNALPPGQYTLRIEARDYAGNRSGPLDLPIIVQAHWWQQGWARIGGLLLLLAGYGIAQWRIRRLRALRMALERRVAARTAELDAANARLLEMARTDELTGIANRRRLIEAMNALARDGAAAHAAMVFVDVDHFKRFNDTHGHAAGDEALRAVARAMRRGAPKGALVARYGGEEFACLLPGFGCASAALVAEGFRHAIADAAIALPAGTNATITISAGVSCGTMREPDDGHRLLREADAALYRAKEEGRNQVRVWSPA